MEGVHALKENVGSPHGGALAAPIQESSAGLVEKITPLLFFSISVGKIWLVENYFKVKSVCLTKQESKIHFDLIVEARLGDEKN